MNWYFMFMVVLVVCVFAHESFTTYMDRVYPAPAPCVCEEPTR